jgi:ubiquitin C-terminal hydrolase
MNELNNFYKGLNNIGNTCYLNSGLQLIISNKELCEKLLNNNISAEIFDFIIQYYNNENYNSLTPSNIKNMVSIKCKEMAGTNVCDSSVFIIYFLELLNNNKIIDNMYNVTTNITIKCKLKTCLHQSMHDEQNNMLMFSINEDYTNLDDCYRNYKLIEHLPYKCDNCNNNTIVSIRTKITNWPNHLIIVLKRFTNNLEKINKSIDIPIQWRHNYILTGFIYHSGNIFGGHYIYIGNKNGKWLMFNDNIISTIDNIDLLNFYKNFSYIYYYSKI